MVYFLLVISFIVDGVLIIGLITLLTRVKKAEELELRQKEVAGEIEDLFSSYLLEIKEENRRLESKIDQQYSREAEKEPVRSAEEDSEENKKAVYTPPQPVETDGTYEPSIHSKIITLYKNGDSVDTVAKKLSMGKTEVELIVKFQEKN
ncbi:DUF6115 domain-containing protein [Halobacillus seohaensis]|uniref:DUF6115 domain-containing protein n=1 Tax=Halobacillus seohaensis TaxID=447421 RepID=A0ABW2EG93_9BACI